MVDAMLEVIVKVAVNSSRTRGKGWSDVNTPIPSNKINYDRFSIFPPLVRFTSFYCFYLF